MSEVEGRSEPARTMSNVERPIMNNETESGENVVHERSRRAYRAGGKIPGAVTTRSVGRRKQSAKKQSS
jgi:hypothetical protein